MEIRENLELVSVEYESNGKKAVMTFLDKERKEVRVVNWNCQSYKDGKFVDDEEKAEKVHQWSRDYFNCEFKKLPDAIGAVKTVYVYDNFNSLFAVSEVKKFTKDMVGQIFQTKLKEVEVGDFAIKLRYEIDGDTYESKHTFGNYVEVLQQWFVDPQKKDKVWAKFKDKYGVPVEEAQSLIGHDLMVEVKNAFGTNYWGDIKKFPTKK